MVKPAKKTSKQTHAQLKHFDEDSDDENVVDGGGEVEESFLPARTSLVRDEEQPVRSSSSKKRGVEVDDDPANFSNEMQRMLDGFGADISKTLCQKKKRVESFTASSLKNTNKKVEELWNTQHQARSKLQEEFGRQVNAVYQQWETDIEKTKDQEEKLNNLFKQQMKMFSQSRIVQSQRLKTIRELSDQFVRSMDDLDRNRQTQQSTLQADLKKEMGLLQKKILMDTQQQEMANVKKSLHSMLFQ